MYKFSRYLYVAFPAFFLFFSTFVIQYNSLTAQSVEEGQQLFRVHCSSCHQIGNQLIGPDLMNVTQRHDEDWLIPFIKNSQEVIKSGDEYAVQLFEKFNKLPMPPVNISDNEVRSILAYIDDESIKISETKETAKEDDSVLIAPPTGTEGTFLGMNPEVAIFVLATVLILLLILLFVLIKIRTSLKELVWKKEHGNEPVPLSTFDKFAGSMKPLLANKMVHALVTVVILIVIVIGGIGYLWEKGQYTGSQKGYKPEQPIPFSHALHAGTHEIDCQYCHTNVTKGASAGIPSINVCMNCHSAIGQLGDQNPNIMEVVEAFKNNTPIEWVRIHNLADHVYFNHSQHVAIGGIDCETCHGNVETMHVVEQVRHLTMGFCIDCHRETEVNFDNEYYKETYKFLKNHENITVSQIGGMECSRCHY